MQRNKEIWFWRAFAATLIAVTVWMNAGCGGMPDTVEVKTGEQIVSCPFGLGNQFNNTSTAEAPSDVHTEIGRHLIQPFASCQTYCGTYPTNALGDCGVNWHSSKLGGGFCNPAFFGDDFTNQPPSRMSTDTWKFNLTDNGSPTAFTISNATLHYFETTTPNSCTDVHGVPTESQNDGFSTYAATGSGREGTWVNSDGPTTAKAWRKTSVNGTWQQITVTIPQFGLNVEETHRTGTNVVYSTCENSWEDLVVGITSMTAPDGDIAAVDWMAFANYNFDPC